jgi:hypothetical protein
MTSGELVARMLELTPAPPSDAGTDELIAAAAAMLAARQLLLDAARGLEPGPVDARLTARLAEREQAWRAAVAAAQCAIGTQRTSAAALRSYARAAR